MTVLIKLRDRYFLPQSHSLQKSLLPLSNSFSISICHISRGLCLSNLYLAKFRGDCCPLKVIAYDNDQPGNSMALHMMEQLPNSIRRSPKAHDWNDELKNMFNLEPQQQPKQPPQPEQKQRWEPSL